LLSEGLAFGQKNSTTQRKEFQMSKEFCPLACTLAELDNEINKSTNAERKAFLEGVRHARIIIRAATGGQIG
jgi:hypothetical protein